MPGQISANAGSMRGVGSKLTGASAEAERLFKATQSLTSRLATTWRGPGGVQFQQMQARLMPDLRRAEIDLKLAADSLFDAAAEYERFEQDVNRNVTRLRAETGRPTVTSNGLDAAKRPDTRVFATPTPSHVGTGAELGAASPVTVDAVLLGRGALGGAAPRGQIDDAVSTIAQAWNEASDLVQVDGWTATPAQQVHALLSKGASALGMGPAIPESQIVHHDLDRLHQVIQQYGRNSHEARAAAVMLCQHAQQLHQALAGKIPGLSALLPVPTFHA
jgi:uncharacterized protein YukE